MNIDPVGMSSRSIMVVHTAGISLISSANVLLSMLVGFRFNIYDTIFLIIEPVAILDEYGWIEIRQDVKASLDR